MWGSCVAFSQRMGSPVHGVAAENRRPSPLVSGPAAWVSGLVCVCVAQYVAFLSTPANQGGDKDRGDSGTGYGGIEEIQGQD